MEKFKKLLEERSKCLLFDADENILNNCGWIGGNAPQYFDDKIALINTENVEYAFYLSIENPINPGNAISVFVPKDYDILMDNPIYPNCLIKVFEHEICDESINPIFQSRGWDPGGSWSMNKHYLHFTEEVEETIIDRQYSDEFDETKDEIKVSLIKFGGKPVLIQGEKHYSEELLNNGYDFVFQIDEQCYPDGLVKGNYPFSFGGLYIYGKISEKSIKNIIAGYLQYS